MIAKITGPPGTGKTTFVLHNIGIACKKYDPGRIGATSYTGAAVAEMRNRVAIETGLSPNIAKNIRTLHSFCYRLLGLQKNEIVTEDSKHIRDWNSAFPKWELPVKSSMRDLEDGESLESSGYDAENNKKRFQRMNIFRERGLPVEKWYDPEAEAFYADWMTWLRESGLMDFTMTLEEVHRRGSSPDIDVLFIDEAQDMSWLQIQVVKQWAEHCESVVWVGDEDQCLYRWSGAAPEDFRNLKKDWANVLQKSYRVPVKVHGYAMRLIGQIKDRDPVTYLPTDEEGDLTRFGMPRFDLPGSRMLIARCSHHLKRWMPLLIDRGIVWYNPYRPKDLTWNPANTLVWEAIRTYDRIKSGLTVTGSELIAMIARLSAESMERGVKTHRKKLVEMDIGPAARADVFKINSLPYFKADFFNFDTPIDKLFPLEGKAGELIQRHGAEITRQEPGIILGTVHSVKGGEADHVMIDPGASPSILRALYESPTARDDEIRISYVAATRARKTLTVLYPRGAEVPVWL